MPAALDPVEVDRRRTSRRRWNEDQQMERNTGCEGATLDGAPDRGRAP